MKFEGTFQYMGNHGIVFNVSQITLTASEGRGREVSDLGALGIPQRKPSDRLLAEVAELVQTPGESRDRLLANSYIPRPEVDKLAYGELAFRLLPQVELIEGRLKAAVKQGTLEPMPISATAFTTWRIKARALDLISADEDALLARYVEYADHGIQVDDFPQDFGLLEALQKRQQTLEQAAKPSSKKRENAPVN